MRLPVIITSVSLAFLLTACSSSNANVSTNNVTSNTTKAISSSVNKEEKIHELFEVMNTKALVETIYDKMKSTFNLGKNRSNITEAEKAVYKNYEDKLLSLLKEKASWNQFKAPFTKIYSENFTLNEIQTLINFYKTPTGKTLVEKTPKITVESMKVSQSLVSKIVPDLRKLSYEMRKELRKARKK